MPDLPIPLLADENAACDADGRRITLPAFERPADPRLTAEGWVRRFMADDVRVQEYVDLYQEMGLEVRMEKVGPEEVGPECGDCRLVICRQFVTLYTRGRA